MWEKTGLYRGLSSPYLIEATDDKKTKKKIPAHYIEKLTIELNGKKLAEANLGPGASKNPTVGVRVSSAKAKRGSKVKVSWSDNKGDKGSKEATI